MRLLRFFEPEETVGTVWHEVANRIGAEPAHADSAVYLSDVRASLAVLFRALGGAHDTEIVEAPATRVIHKRRLWRRLAHGTEIAARPSFDGERLRLPAQSCTFDSTTLNKAVYLWLTAAAALAPDPGEDLPRADSASQTLDRAYFAINVEASKAIIAACPGLRKAFNAMCKAALAWRIESLAATDLERQIRRYLEGSFRDEPIASSPNVTHRVAPLPFWLDFCLSSTDAPGAEESDPSSAPPPAAAAVSTRQGQRRDLEQANRKDSFIVYRFESILSWVESMNINRTVQHDNDEDARKAAEDQDSVTLTKHDKKTASRLHLHLDLSPAEAEHERLAGKFTYPEWNHRKQSYMTDHCRVLEAAASMPEGSDFAPDLRSARRVRRQFEALRTRRMIEPRQVDGTEFDLDALIAARADLLATGRGSDRIYRATRVSQRDLSVALLLDASRSTEADMDGTSVIDVARHALTALAHGLDACGDRFGIWSFSSLRRDRVFVTRCKDFESPMSARVDQCIAGLRPGQYTRLGAAIRHISMRLAKEPSAQKLLLVVTDGKPNDIDHYEGKHGVEDSRMAVREARRQGLVVHGVVIDEDGQDWFARIFERGGFTLLPRPERLLSALPHIYCSLTQEF